MRLLGFALMAGGMTLAVRSGVLLAGRGRPLRGRRPAMVIAGPYVRTRNPLLGGIVMVVVGIAFAMASGVVAAAAICIWLAAHLWVVRVEEPRLVTRFGEAYVAYLRRVPRWVRLPGASPAADRE